MQVDRETADTSKMNLPETAVSEVRRTRGRPRKATTSARRQNPDLKMTTVYLDKKAYAGAQAMLLKSNAEKNQDVTVSDILSGALVKWLNEQ